MPAMVLAVVKQYTLLPLVPIRKLAIVKMCHCVTCAGVALVHSFVTTPITSLLVPAVTSMLTSCCHSDTVGNLLSGSAETRSHVSAMAVPSAVSSGCVYEK